MTIQLLAIMALLVWGGSTAVLLGAPGRQPHNAISAFKCLALALVVTLVIFVVTGALLALTTIAAGVQVWAL